MDHGYHTYVASLMHDLYTSAWEGVQKFFLLLAAHI